MRIRNGVAVLAALPVLVAAKAPVVLQPSSKWVLDYADDSCKLYRTFGEGEDGATLLFERVPPDTPMTMLVVSRHLKSMRPARDHVARFLPHDRARSTSGASARSEAENTAAVLWSSISFATVSDENGNGEIVRLSDADVDDRMRPPPVDPAIRAAEQAEADDNAATATAIQLSSKVSGRTLTLETGSLATPNRMLRQCARQQLERWGVDPEVDERIVRPVFAVKPLSWFSANDYPMKSLRNLHESQLKVRALVDATGKVTDCTPVTRYAAPEFATKVCEVMRERATFEPAELADGTKVASYYIQSITFRLAP